MYKNDFSAHTLVVQQKRIIFLCVAKSNATRRLENESNFTIGSAESTTFDRWI